MTRLELIAFFPPKDGVVLNIGALSYAVPTVAWLVGPCYDAFRERYWNENLDKWKIRWECRDFARAFACFSQECWALTVGGTEDDGLAVGEFWFIPESTKLGEGHAVCACITDQGFVYIDPQNRTLWPMSPEQFSSRFFLRF